MILPSTQNHEDKYTKFPLEQIIIVTNIYMFMAETNRKRNICFNSSANNFCLSLSCLAIFFIIASIHSLKCIILNNSSLFSTEILTNIAVNWCFLYVWKLKTNQIFTASLNPIFLSSNSLKWNIFIIPWNFVEQ